MATTAPSHERVETPVPVGEVVAPRPAPLGTAEVPQQRRSPAASIPAAPAPAGSTTRAWITTTWTHTPPATPPRRETVAVAPAPAAHEGLASTWMTPLHRRSSASLGELAALLTVGAVALVGAVFVLFTTGVPVERAPAVPSPSLSPNVSVPGRVLTSFGDGVWQVGVDIEPGTYASTGSVGGAVCRHALRKARAGDDVAGADAGGEAATVVLTAADGWFATSGCATWKRVG